MRTFSTAAAGGTILFNPRHLLSLHHAYQSPLPRPQARPKTSIFSGENPLPRSLKPLLLLTWAAESTPPPSAASSSSLLEKTIVSDEEFSLAKVLSFPFLLFVFIYLSHTLPFCCNCSADLSPFLVGSIEFWRIWINRRNGPLFQNF